MSEAKGKSDLHLRVDADDILLKKCGLNNSQKQIFMLYFKLLLSEIAATRAVPGDFRWCLLCSPLTEGEDAL